MDTNTDSLRHEIYASMDMKDTQELLEIWGSNDRDEWSDQAFDVIEEILRKRKVEIPIQPGVAEKQITRMSAGKKVKESDYSNIGGWLYLVGIGIILNPLFQLVSMGSLILTLLSGRWLVLLIPGTALFHPLWAPIILYQLLGGIALLILSIVVAVLFIKKHRALPKIFIILLLSYLVYPLILALMVSAIPLSSAQVDSVVIVRNILICLIWIPYFLLSKRVKGTFIHGQDRVPVPGPDLSDSTHWVV